MEKFHFTYSLKGLPLKVLYRRLRHLILRNMATQVYFTEVETIEVLYLFDCIYGTKQYNWIETHLNEMKVLSIFQKLLLSVEPFNPYTKEWAEGVIWQNQAKLSISHEYYGNYAKIGERSTLRKVLVDHKRYKIAQKYIGVGYRDKGNMKNIATEGTPRWQDVNLEDTSRKYEDLWHFQKQAFRSVYGKFYNHRMVNLEEDIGPIIK